VIFDALYESSQRGELMLIDGGFCHWHLRRDGQLTIREIISTRAGAGSEMLARLMTVPGATCTLAANEWYARRGFHCIRGEATKSGKLINVWQLRLSTAPTATADSHR